MLLILNGIFGCGKIVEIPYLEIGSLVFDPLAKFIKRLLLDTLRKLSDRPTDTRLFGEATTGRGPFFLRSKFFILSRGRGSPGGPARKNNFLSGAKLPMPRSGLVVPRQEFVGARTPPTARSKSVCQLTTRVDGASGLTDQFF